MLFKILGAPFSLPVAGMKFVLQQIADQANLELDDEGTLRDQLLLLQVQLEEGDIDQADFDEREAELLARMREVKERKRAEAEAMPVEANVEAVRRVVVETPFDE